MDKFIPFSVRHGYVNPEEILKRNHEDMTEELKVRLWNAIVDYITLKDDAEIKYFVKKIWDKYLKQPTEILKFPSNLYLFANMLHSETTKFQSTLEIVRKAFFKAEWYKIYDIIEYLSSQVIAENEELDKFEKTINQILEEEYAPYRMIEGQITPITDEYEIQTIKKAF